MRMRMGMARGKRVMTTVYTCDRCTWQWMGMELGFLGAVGLRTLCLCHENKGALGTRDYR